MNDQELESMKPQELELLITKATRIMLKKIYHIKVTPTPEKLINYG